MKVADLNSRTIVATIASVDLEAVGEDNKYVARFTENGVKPVVLNLTNSTTIASVRIIRSFLLRPRARQASQSQSVRSAEREGAR